MLGNPFPDDLDGQIGHSSLDALLFEIEHGEEPWASVAIDGVWRLAFSGDEEAQDFLAELLFVTASIDDDDVISLGSAWPEEGE